MSRTILDVHILQTVPPSNINRDDTGSPKTAVYGGVRRARASSQAWKRATRQAFRGQLKPDERGFRTRRVAELLAERIRSNRDELGEDQSIELAAETLRVATGAKIEISKRRVQAEEKEQAPESSYLLFLSSQQLDNLADLAVEGASNIKEFFKSKKNKDRARQAANTRHSVDIALFGRMVADSADLNVDAAVQVSHALSVHAVETESDYYTAVDDRTKDSESGAGMIGVVDFNAATFYRYAAVDVDLLHRNLAAGMHEDQRRTELVRRAVQAFLRYFVTSLPGGKINSFANHTLPDAVIVKLRTSRPINFVGAFESPVSADETGGHLEKSCEQLVAHVRDLERTYGCDSDPTWVLRVGAATESLTELGTEVTLADMVEEVGTVVEKRLESEA